MYLSRLPLDVRRYETMRALAAPVRLHGMIERGFLGERERNLWRIDELRGTTYLLLLSRERPDLSEAQKQIGFDSRPPETRDYAPLLARVNAGSRWRFRLCANPTRSVPQPGQKRGYVEAVTVAFAQREWLERQADKHGFSLQAGEFDVVKSEWVRFEKGRDGARPVTMLRATFEGVLTVKDAALFQEALTQGLGRGKAYGMGLMTVVGCG